MESKKDAQESSVTEVSGRQVSQLDWKREKMTRIKAIDDGETLQSSCLISKRMRKCHRTVVDVSAFSNSAPLDPPTCPDDLTDPCHPPTR